MGPAQRSQEKIIKGPRPCGMKEQIQRRLAQNKQTKNYYIKCK